VIRRRDIRNIYIPEDFLPVWNKFIKICRREGTSASDKIRELIARYVEKKERIINPQTLITRWISEPEWRTPDCRYFLREYGSEVYCERDATWKPKWVCGKCKLRCHR